MGALRLILFFSFSIALFLSQGGRGWDAPFVRSADIAGWTASTAANTRLTFPTLGRWHQSPIPYWMSAASFKVFGVSEITARMVPLVFTIFSGLLIFLILRRIADETAAMLGTLTFWLSPPVLIFAMSNNHIVFSLTAILLAVYLWLRQPKNFALVCGTTLLAMWMYWQAYFLPFLFFAKDRDKRWLAVPFASFAAFLAFKYAMLPEPTEIFDTIAERSGIASGNYRPLRTLGVLLEEGLYYFGAVTLLIAAAGAARSRIIFLVLATCPLLYWLVVPRIAALEPPLNLVMLAPALAVAGGIGISRLPKLASFAAIFLLGLNVSLHRDEWADRLYNIHREDGYEITKRIIAATVPGDTLFEHEHLIGPGRLAYYAWDRHVFVVPDTGQAAYVSHKDGYLVTAHPEVFESVRKKEVDHFSVWHVYRLGEGGVPLGSSP